MNRRDVNKVSLAPAQPTPLGCARSPCLSSGIRGARMPNCSREPQHKRGDCEDCGVCSQCPNADCSVHKGKGHADRASNNKRIKEERISVANELPARDDSRAKAVALHESLAEDKIDKITPAIVLPPSGEMCVLKHIAAALDVPIDAYVERRTERPIALDALESTELGERLIGTLCTISEAVIALVSETDDAAEYLRNAVARRHRGSNRTERVANMVLASSADAFVRARTQVERRAAFARLAYPFGFTRAAELNAAVLAAVRRVLDDAELLGTFKPMKSRRSTGAISTGDAADADGDEEVIGEPGQQPVVLSREDQVRGFVRWCASRKRLLQAKRDFATMMMRRSELQHVRSKSRIKYEAVIELANWMEGRSEGWKGGARRTVDMGDVVFTNMPVLNIGGTATSLFDAFKANGRSGLLENVGEPLFRDVFRVLCRLITENHSLSYFYTDMLNSFDILVVMAERVEQLWTVHKRVDGLIDVTLRAEMIELESAQVTPASFVEAVKRSYTFAKYEMRDHLEVDASKCMGDVMHCCACAVNAPCASEQHAIKTCAACLNYAQIPGNLRKLLNAVRNALMREMAPSVPARVTVDKELSSMLDCVEPIGRILQAFHTHVSRGLWQVAEYKKIVDGLKVGQVLIVTDYKMKILPVNFNQNSEEWYGQKGNSLKGAFVRFREADGTPIKSFYLDTAFIGRTQDATQVQVGLEHMIHYLKAEFAAFNEVIIVSDNGAAFSCKENMAYVFCRNKVRWDCQVVVNMWFFFEAQWGKTTLDTHFSFLNIVLRCFARDVRAVKTAVDVHDALVYNRGVAHTLSFLLDDHTGAQKKVKDKGFASAFQGIRTTRRVEFAQDAVTLYNVSGGLEKTKMIAAKIPVVERSTVVRVAAPWQASASLAVKTPKAVGVPGNNDDEDEDDGSVKAVIATGATDRDKVIAKALCDFAKGHVVAVAQPAALFGGAVLPLDMSDDSGEYFSVSPHAFYKRGWAKSGDRISPPMSQTMKDVVTQMYKEGEERSHKWDPASVAERLRAMPALQQDWIARLASSEKNVQRLFQQLGQQKKKTTKEAASAASAAAARAAAAAEEDDEEGMEGPGVDD